MPTIDYDEANVLLDSIQETRTAIARGETPWSQYVSESGDPKETREGYVGLLDSAQAKLTAIVEEA